MQQHLTRRRFTQLALAGTAAAAIGTLATKTLAQASLQIYGIKAEATSTDGNLVFLSLDVATGKISNSTNAIASNPTALTLEPRERLTGFAFRHDRTPVLTSTSSPNPGKKQHKLKFFGRSAKQLQLSNLNALEVESLIVDQDDSILALVAQSNGTPPFGLVRIDSSTGQISSVNFPLPKNRRFGNLVKCPDGTIYASTSGDKGDISLVKLDMAQRQLIGLPKLNFNGEALEDIVDLRFGLSDLACSPSGQLFALGTRVYDIINDLHILDPDTGSLSLVTQFDVNKIAFIPA